MTTVDRQTDQAPLDLAGMTQGTLLGKLKRSRESLEAAIDAAHDFHQEARRDIALDTIRAVAAALKTVRKAEQELVADAEEQREIDRRIARIARPDAEPR